MTKLNILLLLFCWAALPASCGDSDDPAPGEESPADYIEPDQTGMRDLTSLEFAKLMTLGWNLGNSLEAINVNNG